MTHLALADWCPLKNWSSLSHLHRRPCFVNECEKNEQSSFVVITRYGLSVNVNGFLPHQEVLSGWTQLYFLRMRTNEGLARNRHFELMSSMDIKSSPTYFFDSANIVGYGDELFSSISGWSEYKSNARSMDRMKNNHRSASWSGTMRETNESLKSLLIELFVIPFYHCVCVSEFRKCSIHHASFSSCTIRLVVLWVAVVYKKKRAEKRGREKEWIQITPSDE